MQNIQHQQLPRRASRKIDLDDLSNITLFIALFIGIWQLVFMLGIWPRVSMPSPAMVAESFAGLLQDFTLVTSIGMTMYRLAIGFTISITSGVAVGLAMVKFPGFGKTMSSFAVGLQSFPSVAWVPFAILLIGLNDFGILFVVIMSSVFSAMISIFAIGLLFDRIMFSKLEDKVRDRWGLNQNIER